MVTGKFISLNTRGISNYRKRRTIFTWLRKQKPDVIFLQETHSTQGNEACLQKEWGATLICSHGANNARGVAILIRNNFDCVVEDSVIDSNGRFIILKVLLSGEPTLLVNMYGPNRDNELVAFYHTVLQIIVNKNFDDIENIIMEGDLNCPLNPIIDKRGGNLIPRQALINAIELLQSELGSEVNKPNFNFEDLPIPTLSNDSSDLGEGLISIEECKKVLNSFPLNKVPGNDGLPIEFYKTFWDFIGVPLVASFNESFVKGKLSSSQRQAVITLIEEKDQDRCDLKNWRPISLLNVDAKIASKVIAERMKRLLPGLIHHNQSGYIPGRNISENIRSILDIMEYTKVKKIPGLLLFIDFEKAFDSLEWDFFEKCLERFNFGPDFRRWVPTFYTDVQSCVINNGLCSQYLHIKRGVRQGDPLSPYLFIIAVEILAIAIRNREDIKGITIGGLETKLLQFADDTTAVLSDLDSTRALFGLLEIFEKASGLKLNVKKTEAMWIGSLQNCEYEPLGVRCKTCVKFLGIYITYDVQVLVKKNFKQRLKNIKNTIHLWKSRGLSIHWKVNIIKTLLLLKMIYPSSVICTPYEVIKEFNSLIFRFLWNGNDKLRLFDFQHMHPMTKVALKC